MQPQISQQQQHHAYYLLFSTKRYICSKSYASSLCYYTTSLSLKSWIARHACNSMIRTCMCISSVLHILQQQYQVILYQVVTSSSTATASKTRTFNGVVAKCLPDVVPGCMISVSLAIPHVQRFYVVAFSWQILYMHHTW